MEKNNKLNEHLEYIDFNVSETEYEIPINDDEIRSNLYRKIQKDNFELEAETLYECLENEDKEMLNKFEKCKADLVLSETFFIYKNYDYPPKKYFVTNQNYFKLEFYLKGIAEIDRPNMKYILGGRGIGKTLTMNMLLVNNFDFLCKNKIIFVRCDAKKFLNIKDAENENKDEFSISDYIDAQFLYILCEKINDIEFYKAIRLELQNEKYVHINSKEQTYDNLIKEDRNIATQLDRYYDYICTWKRQGLHYLRDLIIRDKVHSPQTDTSRAYNNWVNLSREIQRILKQRGYKFLKIIDGIDNIQKYDENGMTKEYKLIINYSSNFEAREKGKSFLWFFMRKNTYYVYKQNHQIKDENRAHHKDKIEFDLNVINKNEIINKRMNVFDVSKIYLNGLDVNYSIDDLTKNDLIVYSRHIKDFIYNWVSFLFSHSLYKKYNPTRFGRNFYYSNLLLNGCLFLDTQHIGNNERKDGNILFNIFYHNIDIINSNNNWLWHGWCATRILQLVKQKEITENDLSSILTNLFRYNEEHIRIAFKTLMSYGFIRFCERDDKMMCEITESGKYLIDFFFSRLELLYYCALDTPLPKFCIKDKLITSHNNDKNTRTFAENCIRTATTFISFLNFQHEIEMERLKAKENVNCNVKIFENPLENLEIAERLCNRIDELKIHKDLEGNN